MGERKDTVRKVRTPHFGKAFWMSLLRHPAVMSIRNAVLWGVFWLLVATIAGWYYNVVPASVVSYTWGGVSLLTGVVMSVSMWLAAVLPLYFGAMVVERGVRLGELFGRTLFAHSVVTLLMLPVMFGDQLAYSLFVSDPLDSLSGDWFYGWGVLLLAVVTLVWYLYWCYLGFSTSVKRSDKWVVVVYAVAQVVAVVLSRMVLKGMLI